MLNNEQRNQIRSMIYDVFAEMYKHKRIDDNEMGAIISYLSEGDAYRNYFILEQAKLEKSITKKFDEIMGIKSDGQE